MRFLGCEMLWRRKWIRRLIREHARINNKIIAYQLCNSSFQTKLNTNKCLSQEINWTKWTKKHPWSIWERNRSKHTVIIASNPSIFQFFLYSNIQILYWTQNIFAVAILLSTYHRLQCFDNSKHLHLDQNLVCRHQLNISRYQNTTYYTQY